MEESRIKKGVHVTISDDLSNTDRAWGTNGEMMEMMGKTYKIDQVDNTHKGVGAIIRYFTWHPKDLIEVSPKKKPEPFHFDVEELNI